MSKKRTAFDKLGTHDSESGHLNVVIETPKGNRNKFKYDPDLGMFRINKVLPAGAVFPFDFGFVPGTAGDDGDPLDVLVLMDEPAFTGCLVPARLVGVIEAEQSEDGAKERNDRLIAVAAASLDNAELRDIDGISPALVKEIEHFFASYNQVEGKKWKAIGCAGPKRAEKLVAKGAARLTKRQK